jgi:hypothetical protein
LDKYLKSRKGRKLIFDEKENIIKVVKVLRFTIDQMPAIDDIWKRKNTVLLSAFSALSLLPTQPRMILDII